MRRVVFNQKGGVGKSSIACNLAAVSAAAGYKTLVIDLDVQQGDGTAEIFRGDDAVYTFSMHCQDKFPVRKQAGDRDVGLAAGIGDETYLEILSG